MQYGKIMRQIKFFKQMLVYFLKVAVLESSDTSDSFFKIILVHFCSLDIIIFFLSWLEFQERFSFVVIILCAVITSYYTDFRN